VRSRKTTLQYQQHNCLRCKERHIVALLSTERMEGGEGDEMRYEVGDTVDPGSIALTGTIVLCVLMYAVLPCIVALADRRMKKRMEATTKAIAESHADRESGSSVSLRRQQPVSACDRVLSLSCSHRLTLHVVDVVALFSTE
jgi:hypothetical protein